MNREVAEDVFKKGEASFPLRKKPSVNLPLRERLTINLPLRERLTINLPLRERLTINLPLRKRGIKGDLFFLRGVATLLNSLLTLPVIARPFGEGRGNLILNADVTFTYEIATSFFLFRKNSSR
jgi:hypothetical protein